MCRMHPNMNMLKRLKESVLWTQYTCILKILDHLSLHVDAETVLPILPELRQFTSYGHYNTHHCASKLHIRNTCVEEIVIFPSTKMHNTRINQIMCYKFDVCTSDADILRNALSSGKWVMNFRTFPSLYLKSSC